VEVEPPLGRERHGLKKEIHEHGLPTPDRAVQVDTPRGHDARKKQAGEQPRLGRTIAGELSRKLVETPRRSALRLVGLELGERKPALVLLDYLTLHSRPRRLIEAGRH
jgi:hypothetical protein